jgi:hypothetical protein
MRVLGFLFFILAFLMGGTASAEEAKGWLGADVVDVTKAEADKLGWDVPQGAKLDVVATGSRHSRSVSWPRPPKRRPHLCRSGASVILPQVQGDGTWCGPRSLLY